MERDFLKYVNAPERLSHRYHLIRAVVTLSAMGTISLLLGFTALVDAENFHPLRYFSGCALVLLVCGLGVRYLLQGDSESTAKVEAAMLAGLFATFANTIYGGLLGTDPWWQVCGYLAVLLIVGGVSLRRWGTFYFYIVIGLVAWAVTMITSDESWEFIFDSFVLVLLGCVVGAAILWLFRIERRQVTELNRELHESATHDPLTGILNRHGLLSEASHAETLGGQTWCAYLDVDFFKSINDRRGHDHGDEVLRAVAWSLADAGGELTARWGGDEFVTIGYGRPPEAVAIENAVNLGVHEVDSEAAVTVGLATGTAHGRDDLDRLIRDADRKMYDRRAAARGEHPSATA